METKKSLQRILTELKTLGSRISDRISALDVIGVTKGGKSLGRASSREIGERAAADLQQVRDLIERVFTLKSALAAMNSATRVEIGGRSFTIADVIIYKTSIIPLKKQLLSRLRRCYRDASAVHDDLQAEAEVQLSKLLEAAFGSKDAGGRGADVRSLSESFRSVNEIGYVDPVGLLDYMNKLEEEISVFEDEVDAVLSEANAVTLATV